MIELTENKDIYIFDTHYSSLKFHLETTEYFNIAELTQKIWNLQALISI